MKNYMKMLNITIIQELGYEDINDTLKYLINYNGNVNDIFYNLHLLYILL